MTSQSQNLTLITGASGYVGSRLAALFEREGLPLRVMGRRPEFLKDRFQDQTQVVYGDVLDKVSLEDALQGVKVAYYLVHSLASQDYQSRDREGAQNFLEACESCGVERIIYLGGLGTDYENLSPHLKSRQEVGRILRSGKIPVIEFQASIVIGSGSLSFEMVRALVERLPIMITPSWVRVPAQPIGIEDLIAYLSQAKDKPLTNSGVYEVGGADVTSYGELMQAYAHVRGLKRFMIPVPFLTPWLSSLWLGFVTPLYARVGRKLMTSLKNPTVVTDTKARTDFQIEPMGIEEAISRALSEEDQVYGRTRWCDAISSAGLKEGYGGVKFAARIVEDRVIEVSVPPKAAFDPIRRIGGETGWYYGNFLWKIRGFVDLLFGGVGLRRGRADPYYIRVGEPLDFWRVEQFVPGQKLRLKAEMKLPGRAWLQFEVRDLGEGRSQIEQTAIFDPMGILGRAYWYVLYPLHRLIFKNMLKNIAKAALKAHNTQ